jgi:hypothetical protein
MTATAFEQRVQQAVEALDGWMGEDVARAELAADIYEEVARRAPVELWDAWPSFLGGRDSICGSA